MQAGSFPTAMICPVFAFDLIGWPNLAKFLLTAGAIVLSPGPDTMLILRNTLVGGRFIGLMTVAGVQLGLIGHTLAATLGLSLLLQSWPLAFKIIAALGAAYLGWLGWQTLRAGALPAESGQGGLRVGPVQALRDAALTNLLNPKVILLFLSLMPPFVNIEAGHVGAQLLFLCILLLALNILWQAPLALLAEAMRRFLLGPRAQKWLTWASGAILLFFAGLLLWDNVVS